MDTKMMPNLAIEVFGDTIELGGPSPVAAIFQICEASASLGVAQLKRVFVASSDRLRSPRTGAHLMR